MTALAPAADVRDDDGDGDAPVEARELSRLKWRCRRGLLENDLLIERFFAAHEAALTRRQARGLQALMDLADNDLLDLLLGRTEPADGLRSPETLAVLALLRPRRAASSAAPEAAAPPTHTATHADFGTEEP